MRRGLLAGVLLAVTLTGCEESAAPPRPLRIVVIPIGPVAPELLAHLRDVLPQLVDGEVRIGEGIAVPEAAFDSARRQYLGSALLAALKRQPIQDAERIVGVIDADAYAPGLNFILGQAERPGRVAVVALPRLRQSSRERRNDPAQFRDRVAKVTVHELGHSFGFAHCPDTTCVMHFANAVGDTDHQGFRYCARER